MSLRVFCHTPCQTFPTLKGRYATLRSLPYWEHNLIDDVGDTAKPSRAIATDILLLSVCLNFAQLS